MTPSWARLQRGLGRDGRDLPPQPAAKPFKQLMGAPCTTLTRREAGGEAHLGDLNASTPIARGLPDHFELETEEMYGRPFGVPGPWRRSSSRGSRAKCSRSGLTYRRGAGNIFAARA